MAEITVRRMIAFWRRRELAWSILGRNKPRWRCQVFIEALEALVDA